MGFIESAKKVLGASNQPLSIKEITETALRQGILITTGKTPESTMSALIGKDIRENGTKSFFVKISQGVYGARAKHASTTEQSYLPTMDVKEDLINHRLPKFDETFTPILKILSGGNIMNSNELKKKVRDVYYAHLSDELLNTKTKGDKPLILATIHFGTVFLKFAGIVERPERGKINITQKGQSIIDSKGGFTLNDLNADEQYRNGLKQRQDAKKINTVPESEEPEINKSNKNPKENDEVEHLEDTEGLQDTLLGLLKNTDAYLFQDLVLELLSKMGYGKIESTPKSGDGGIDGIIHQDELGLDKIYFQSKRYTENKVTRKHMDEFIGSLSVNNSKKGIFVTTSSFSQSAIERTRMASQSIIMVDGEKLSQLMYDYNFGVRVIQTKEIDYELLAKYSPDIDSDEG